MWIQPPFACPSTSTHNIIQHYLSIVLLQRDPDNCLRLNTKAPKMMSFAATLGCIGMESASATSFTSWLQRGWRIQDCFRLPHSNAAQRRLQPLDPGKARDVRKANRPRSACDGDREYSSKMQMQDQRP